MAKADKILFFWKTSEKVINAKRGESIKTFIYSFSGSPRLIFGGSES